MQSKKIIKEEEIDIPDDTQKVVKDRIEHAKAHPETMLDWEIVSEQLLPTHYSKNFDASKFLGVLKVDEDALIIQKRLRDEWN